MKRIKNPICAVLLAVSAFNVCAAPGDVDLAFVVSTIPECRNPVLAPSLSGASYVACPSLFAEWVVYKFRADGTRDTRWGTGGIARRPVLGGLANWVSYAGEDPDGGFRIVSSDGRVVRFRANGSPDTDFAKLVEGSQSNPLFAGIDSYSGSLQVAPDGGMVGLIQRNLGGNTRDALVSKLSASGNLAVPATQQVYALPDMNGSFSAYFPILAWSLQADDALEVLLPDHFITTFYGDVLGDLRLYRIVPGGVPVIQTGRTFPARGIANFTHPQFRVLGDGSKLLGDSLTGKWLPDGKIDPAFGRYVKDSLVGPYLINLCNNHVVSILANDGFITYDSKYTYLGPLGRSRCDGVDSAPHLANGNADATRPAATSPMGGESLAYSLFIAQDGGIVTLRNSDKRLQRFQGYGPRAEVTVVEYYAAEIDHYFMTATQNEIDVLDSGTGPGWKRTGYRFGAWNIDTPMPNTEPVCRFYGDLTAGPNSHFYSAEKFECDILAGQEAATPIGRPAWRFERNAFRITLPVLGKCLDGLVPIRRVYNNARPGKDSNHRYLSSETEYQAMLAKGWVDEGVHMCATPNPPQ